jgi:hypothetical protein
MIRHPTHGECRAADAEAATVAANPTAVPLRTKSRRVTLSSAIVVTYVYCLFAAPAWCICGQFRSFAFFFWDVFLGAVADLS